MINEYVMKLIDNLPDDIKNAKEPLVIDYENETIEQIVEKIEYAIEQHP
jgi:hypothetical protein